MTDKQLIAHQQQVITTQAQRIDALEHQLNQLLKLIYGQKSERFVGGVLPDQLSIFEAEEPASEPEEKKEQIQYERKKPKPHPGRHQIPDHLPVKEIVIEPDEPVEDLKIIGKEVTETLDYRTASLTRMRIIRYKYEKPGGEGILIAELPPRPIEKGIAEASLLAHILVSKFVDHRVLCKNVNWIKAFEAVLKMRVGPSIPAYRSWYQTAVCCSVKEAGW